MFCTGDICPTVTATKSLILTLVVYSPPYKLHVLRFTVLFMASKTSENEWNENVWKQLSKDTFAFALSNLVI